MIVKVKRSAKTGESSTGDVELFRFTVEGANFPAVGDRLVFRYIGMTVLERTWHIEIPGYVELRVEVE